MISYWPDDGTPKSQRNAFDWRNNATLSMTEENHNARLGRITRQAKDKRLEQKQMHIYSRAGAKK